MYILDLALNNGRQDFFHDEFPRSQRLCTVPDCGDYMENEIHMICKCKAYAHIRLDPTTPVYSHVVDGDMKRFLRHNPQNILALVMNSKGEKIYGSICCVALDAVMVTS